MLEGSFDIWLLHHPFDGTLLFGDVLLYIAVQVWLHQTDLHEVVLVEDFLLVLDIGCVEKAAAEHIGDAVPGVLDVAIHTIEVVLAVGQHVGLYTLEATLELAVDALADSLVANF